MDGVIQRDKNEGGHGMNNEDLYVFMDKYKNVQGKISLHVFLVMIVFGAQFFPGIPYRL